MSEDTFAVPNTIAVRVVAAKNLAATDANNAERGEKQGAIFCGECCDLRRAVIVVTIVAIGVHTFLFFAYRIGLHANDFGYCLGASGFFAYIYFVSLFFFVFQMVAAILYSVRMLGTAVAMNSIVLGLGLWGSFCGTTTGGYNNERSIEGMVHYWRVDVVLYVAIWALCVYPTVGLLLEIKNGIMSRDTYPREAHCWCC